MLKQYLDRAAEIIGERTPDETRFDREVIRWLAKGKPIRRAIARANEKYPSEALKIDELDDGAMTEVAAHYDYLMQHERIMRMLDGMKD